MTLHLPTRQAGYADHHLLRNTLVAIVLAIVALLVVYALATTDLGTTVEPATMTDSERLVEFRAGERMPLAVPPMTESERMVEFRAGERMPLAVPPMTESERMVEFRAGERGD